MSMPAGFADKVAVVWKVADKLRGHFKPHEYGAVMLPLLVLRRLDAVLEPTKAKVLAKAEELEDSDISNPDLILKKVAKQSFYNTSPLTLAAVLADDKHVAKNLRTYLNGFSPSAVEVMEAYRLDDKIARLDKAGILYQVLGDFVDLDLHPDKVSNEAMGYVFEELLRKFSEMSNETAGEHYTPREVIRLMVNLLFAEDSEALSGPAPIRTVYDVAAGTGGMLTVAADYLTELNPQARVEVYGQELNPETWAIARSDLMIKGSDPARMALGNSLTEDAWAGRKFDYMLANPPYGVDWKAYATKIKEEAAQPGGRFVAGLPRISDGSFLFLQALLSKMKPVEDRPETTWIDGGSRIGIVLSGSPLFSGGAGSGESEIRRWIIENDWLEAIVALPDQMFYNTGINTYVWILTNRKPPERQGTVTLVDAREMGTKMRKSLGDKRKELTSEAIAEITRLYTDAPDLNGSDARVKVMRNVEFGYARLTVERPVVPVDISDGALKILAARPEWQAWLADPTPVTYLDDDGETHTWPGPTTPDDIFGALVDYSWDKRTDFLDEVQDAYEGVPPVIFDSLIECAAEAAPIINMLISEEGLKQAQADAIRNLKPDPSLRDQENIPLPADYLDLDEAAQEVGVREAAEAHLISEIRPYAPDAWIDHTKTRIGYEIPFTRQFYVYVPPRPVAEIRAEIDALEVQIQEWMKGLIL